MREALHITVEPAAAAKANKPVRSFLEAGFPKAVLATCRRVVRTLRTCVAAPADAAGLTPQRLQAAVAHPGAVLAHRPARCGASSCG